MNATATTLADLLARRGRLPIKEACTFAIQLLEQFGTLHTSGNAFGALEPAAVRIDTAGLATLGEPGTHPYLAPEQEIGGAAIPRTDLYATGILLYAMVTGNANRLRIPVDGAPPWLSTIIERATRASGAERFATAAEMRAQIDMGLSGLLQSTPSDPDETVVGAPPVEATIATLPQNGCPECRFDVPTGRASCPNCGYVLYQKPTAGPAPLRPSSPGAAQVNPPVLAARPRPMPTSSGSSASSKMLSTGAFLFIAAVLAIGIIFYAMKKPITDKLMGKDSSTPAGNAKAGTPGTVQTGCGYCNGDGRIDPDDQAREVPRTTAPLGRCPYCVK